MSRLCFYIFIFRRSNIELKVDKYLSLVTFSHTVFALPFAIVGFTLATTLNDQSQWSYRLFFLMIACMVFARSAAMAFNRYLDRDIDKLNPRTVSREIPSGQISSDSALLFTIFNCLAFMLATYFINRLCFMLSPVALLIILGYSYTKRFTPLCHLILGLGLALAPVGAFFTILPQWNVLVVFYGLAVLFWVSGFDVIYAMQDREFDKKNKLFSIPVYFGPDKALTIAKFLHIFSFIFCFIAVYITNQQVANAGFLHYVAVAVFGSALVYQHSLVRADDLSRVNRAFFTSNGIASVIFGAIIVTDLLL